MDSSKIAEDESLHSFPPLRDAAVSIKTHPKKGRFIEASSDFHSGTIRPYTSHMAIYVLLTSYCVCYIPNMLHLTMISCTTLAATALLALRSALIISSQKAP